MKTPGTLSRALLLLSLLALTSAGNASAAEPMIDHGRWLPLTAIERAALQDESGKLHGLRTPLTPFNTSRPKVPRRLGVFADRREYTADDPVGQFLVYLIGEAPGLADSPPPGLPPEGGDKGASLIIEVIEGDAGAGRVVASRTLQPVQTPKLALLLKTGDLPPGAYRLRARLQGVPAGRTIPDCVFIKSDQRRDTLAYPAQGVRLLVHEQAHVPDGAWPMTTGIPLPRGAADSVDRFILTEDGTPVPAQFSTRATWYPDGSQVPGVKWMGLDFVARYKGGKPAEYRLLRADKPAAAAQTALKVRETPEQFVVDTAAIRFTIDRRRFAGVQDVRLIDANGQPGQAVIAGGGGPYLIDERGFRYEAANDASVQVVLEESGPLRATLHATGWYTSDRDEKCGIFHTRLTAYAGEPRIDVEQRTIITYDTDRKKLQDLGFAFKPVAAQQWQFGGDGRVHAGTFAAAEAPTPDPRKPAPIPHVWLHQDRWDHFRVMRGDGPAPEPLSEGERSDGWATLQMPAASVSLMVRDIWQLYPKELEVGPELLNVHTWPRHGHTAMSDEETFTRQNIHKIFYAHQGAALDLKLPQRYFHALQELGAEFGPGGRVLEQQDINALSANGRGLATSTQFSLRFHAGAPPEDVAARAALYQQDPHAIADPIYAGLTEVEGRFAGYDPQRFPDLERVLTEGYRGYTLSVDYLNAYGMWIWPDTHNNWSPVTMAPELHRWWTLGHYQNPWEGLFLYFRSGDPSLLAWARANTRHVMDVGTVNYHDPAEPMQGKLTGAMYHTKGFLPWGSPRYGERTGDDYVEVGAHFVNPDAANFRYLLLGDRRGRELMQVWGESFRHVALPPERSRECVNTLAEMLSYYQTTWDPQAILYIHDLAADINSRPWAEIPAFPAHPMYNDRWVQRYWEFTRDPLVKQRVLEWFSPDSQAGRGKYAYPQLRALAWRWTGDASYLSEHLPEMAALWRRAYDNPQDPLHAYGARRYFFPTHSLAQMAPYYMQAVKEAGLRVPGEEALTPTPIARAVTPKKEQPGDWFALPPRTTADALVVGYLQVQGGEPALELTFSAWTDTRHNTMRAEPGHIRIRDATGKVLLETTVLSASQRASATVTLDGRTSRGPWEIVRCGPGLLTWTGPAEAVNFTPQP